MALLPNINVGSAPNDGTGSSLRDAFTIVNENFQFIEAFFPNSSVANLVANIESTGTSIFNIANVDVLNVNTISSYTTANITAGNITATTGTFDTITANTVTGFTVTGNITANIESTGNSSFNVLVANSITANSGNLTTNITSTGNSSFNITSYSGNASFGLDVSVIGTLSSNVFLANVGIIDSITNNTFLSANAVDANIVSVAGNLSTQGELVNFSSDTGLILVEGIFRSNGLFFSNTVTISTDANLDLSLTDYNRVQTVIANLTAGNLTVTLPNASTPRNEGLTYTFICYDEGGLDNRTLTVNVQPGSGNIWTSANTQSNFVNISAELGTNSVELKTNEIYWFTY